MTAVKNGVRRCHRFIIATLCERGRFAAMLLTTFVATATKRGASTSVTWEVLRYLELGSK